ncbi:hypothetical protein DL240_16500 [Lujinxingia litoralis]|uniref:Uncharacterized protein n=1 Tax=Lujinxingia litoralis TaxID=2211119 RepID=A0A328C6L5_9DELT|nr:hypothetical protein [Lujinxingia litoralis]RAL20631.1 hypothetical protein DL240_16500 [Lujinxingia litoralis]
MKNSWLKTWLKIAGCGLLVATIGAVVVVGSPEGVHEAEADIAWLSLTHRSGQERFVDALQSAGLDNARAYDWNGNLVYFAFDETEETPLEVSLRLQAEMVKVGLNKRVYTYPVDPMSIFDEEGAPEVKAEFLEATTDFFGGGLVPVEETDGYIALNGAELHAEIETLEDVIGVAMEVAGNEEAVQEAVRATRFVEAFRTPENPRTQVVAVYSQDHVDLTKFRPDAPGVQFLGELQDDIPACPGCVRSSRLAGTGDEKDYLMLSFDTPASRKATIDFYQKALVTRGWELQPTAVMIEKMIDDGLIQDGDIQGEIATFSRGELMIHVHVYDATEGAGSAVTIFKAR